MLGLDGLNGQANDASTWQARSAARCIRALGGVSATGDRLALLRSLARVRGGRIDLSVDNIVLGPADVLELDRFGLRLSDERQLRIIDERHLPLPPGYLEAERLDPVTRRLHPGASPDAVLVRHTRHSAYSTRAQKAGVRAVLTMPDGGGLMVSMPTGSGKSLLFQLDTLVRRGRRLGSCAVVITPTVSLALDHARTLSTIPGLEGSRALTGDLTRTERVGVIDAFRRGEVPVLLLSPEIALREASALVEAATPAAGKLPGLDGRLTLLVIDEAHIVENWGRTFRPDFQRLPALLDALRVADGGMRLLLLSATLSPAARRVLRAAYGRAGPWLEVDAQSPRYEFDVVVEKYATAEERLVALDQVVDRAPRPMIVYATLVDEADADAQKRNERVSAEEIYSRMRARGYDRVALFTGAIDAAARRRIVDDWSADRLDVVVATSAFGMGIDKADVRAVVHACLPEGASRWYQEIGRASRDGHQGMAVCLFTDGHSGARTDVGDAFSQVSGSWLTREKAVGRWSAMVERSTGVRWTVGGRRRLTLDLDAVRDGLPLRRSEHNRLWNMSLLNLLQRAGMIEVATAGGEGTLDEAWDVEMLESRLLLPTDDGVWDRVFALRNEELRHAGDEVRSFADIMRNASRRCVVQSVFGLIEGDEAETVEPCGRCPACRARGSRPPSAGARQHGLERAWRGLVVPRCALPSGLTLVDPDDASLATGYGILVLRLAAAGIDQFVVPDELVAETASVLRDRSAELGLVLACSEWLAPGTALSERPTAVVLPAQGAAAMVVRLLAGCRDFVAAVPGVALVIVGNPARRVAERRLDQSASRFAPYSEEALDRLGGAPPELA